MIIKFYDEEYKETEYVKIDREDKKIQDKADFFFEEDNLMDNETFEDLSYEDITKNYNKMFSESITVEQVKDAFDITDNCSCGQTIDRYIDVLNTIGFKAESLTPKEDFVIVIKEW